MPSSEQRLIRSPDHRSKLSFSVQQRGLEDESGARPAVWTTDKLRTARLMRANREYDVSSIAKALGVSRASVYRALQEPAVGDAV